MRVKVGDTWYDSSEQPLAVETSDQEREHIGNMSEGIRTYASAPDDWFGDSDAFLQWLKGDDDAETDS